MILSEYINMFLSKALNLLYLILFSMSVHAITPAPYDAYFRVLLNYNGDVEITSDLENRLLDQNASPSFSDLKYSTHWIAEVGSADLSILDKSFAQKKDYTFTNHSDLPDKPKSIRRINQAKNIKNIQTLRTAICKESYIVNNTLADNFSTLIFFCALQKSLMFNI